MARIDVDIEDYLDEVDAHYLLQELLTRKKRNKLSQRDLESLEECVKDFSEKKESIELVKTLDDSLKFDAFKFGFRNKTVADIEKFFGY